MPIFEYICNSCQHKFEELVFGSAPKVSCPKCRKRRVTKQFSVFAFKSGSTFVGSGPSGDCGSCTTGNCSTCH